MYPVILIPSYQPTMALVKLVDALCACGDQDIIIVNDGSDLHTQPIFDRLNSHPSVRIVTHACNLGKGEALKTGFNEYLLHADPQNPGVVTADADGQHHPEDIQTLRCALAKEPKSLWLGVRVFDDQVPWKSRMGNRVTRQIFNVLIGKKITDTQTGLRAIPRSFLSTLIKSKTSGYEFELEMLIIAMKCKINIQEIAIKTLYENNNAGSHFNPMVDSLKIYFVFLRFLTFSFYTGCLDFIVFFISYKFIGIIFLSECLARFCGGVFGFTMNKIIVFKTKEHWPWEAMRYSLLAIAFLGISYAILTTLISLLNMNVFFSKAIASTGLFLASFAIQRVMIFRE
jgi:glycosyltransferase involved in cell wall biosynthesis